MHVKISEVVRLINIGRKVLVAQTQCAEHTPAISRAGTVVAVTLKWFARVATEAEIRFYNKVIMTVQIDRRKNNSYT